MEDAKMVAATGYKQVFEDGPEFCSSESEAEYSDHGEELTGMGPNPAKHTSGPDHANVLLLFAPATGIGWATKVHPLPRSWDFV
jgi:hypothetical protein